MKGNEMVEFNPMEVGNILTVGFMEDEQEREVKRCCDWIYKMYGRTLTHDQMTQAIVAFNIDYCGLPSWLQSEFDWFDIEG